MATLISRALRTSLNQVRHVTPVRPAAATGLVADVYAQVERDFGMLAPPTALHSPAPGPLAASWAMLRETLLADGLVDRASKEVVAATVSKDNECPYCVAVHGATVEGLLGTTEVDGAHQAIEDWTHAAVTAETARATGFPSAWLPELIGVAVTFQYLNRMVHIFLGESPLPPNVPDGMRGRAMKFLGGFMRKTAIKPHAPGAALALLPDAELPADLAWAAGNPSIAGAMARAAATIDAVDVPANVRELVSAEVDAWTGQAKGPSRRWVEDAVAGLPIGDQPAGRLALLTALAPYQIDDGIVIGFRQMNLSDRALIELTSWASMTAARRAGAWTWAGHTESTQS